MTEEDRDYGRADVSSLAFANGYQDASYATDVVNGGTGWRIENWHPEDLAPFLGGEYAKREYGSGNGRMAPNWKTI